MAHFARVFGVVAADAVNAAHGHGAAAVGDGKDGRRRGGEDMGHGDLLGLQRRVAGNQVAAAFWPDQR